MALAVLLLYALLLAAVAFGVFQFTAWVRHRRVERTVDIPAGFELTDEVYYDPTTGVKQRVWYNASTGERFYETVNSK